MWRRLSSQLRVLTPSLSPPKCNLFAIGSVSSSLTSEIVRPSVALYNRHFSSELGNASKKNEVERGNLLETRLNMPVYSKHNRLASLASLYQFYRSCLSQYNTMVPSFPRRFITTSAASVNVASDDTFALTTPRIKFKRLDKTAKHIMQILDKEAVEEVRVRKEIPDIKPGYIIQLKLEVPENKRRVSIVKGIVIARRNAGLNTTFRLRRLVAGVGVENLFHFGWLFSATKLVNPFFVFLDPEVAHRLAVSAAARGWVPREKRPDLPILGLDVWGRRFSNPVGLAAGFHKNAEAVEGLLGLGFGFVEVGSVTPIPQEGYPKPRIFRLPNEGALINRCGFNSEGIVAVAKRLGAQHGKRKLETSGTSAPAGDEVKHGGKAGPGILGVNLGKNKTSEDAAADYVQGVHTLSQYADYLVINISSPNTPGLRQLQGRKQLKDLVKKVQAARDEMQWGEEGPPPLLVKIAPDLSKQDLEDIAAVALALRVDGLIISNTTIQRPDSVSKNPVAQETGGLSGNPLFNMSTNILQEMYLLTKGRIPLIGCGGISSGEDAYKKNPSWCDSCSALYSIWIWRACTYPQYKG